MGLVCLALAAPDGIWVQKIRQGLDWERIRYVSASHAFGLTRRYLSGLEVKQEQRVFYQRQNTRCSCIGADNCHP